MTVFMCFSKILDKRNRFLWKFETVLKQYMYALLEKWCSNNDNKFWNTLLEVFMGNFIIQVDNGGVEDSNEAEIS